MSGHENIAWGDEVNGLRLGISTERDHYRPEERPFILTIFIINVGARTVQIVESHVLHEYDIEVCGPGDQRVAMNPEGDKTLRAARTLPPAGRTAVSVEPGVIHAVAWPIRLAEWFDLNVSGAYTVSVRRRDWPGDQGLLVSGPLTLTVDAVKS